MKTNLGYNVKVVCVDWKDRGRSLCYSCGKEKCDGCIALFDKPDYNKLMKKNRIRIVTTCKGYKEQKFKISEEEIVTLRGFIENYCYHNCAGKHNISQSSDSFDYMVSMLTLGIIYCLAHRKEFNELQRKGDLFIKFCRRKSKCEDKNENNIA